MRQCSECGVPFARKNPKQPTCSRKCGYDRVSRLLTVHGEASFVREKKTFEYATWLNMRARCVNPKNEFWHDYGGRGIRVCQRWDDYSLFLADMGRRPAGCTIDRIDNDGHYEPGNCRWATSVEQGFNKRNNRFVTLNGERMKLDRAASIVGIPADTIRDRLHQGWSEERAMSQPVGVRHDDVCRRIVDDLAAGPRRAMDLDYAWASLQKAVRAGLVSKGDGKTDPYELTPEGLKMVA